MDAFWTLVWMLTGASLFALGHYVGGVGTVRRLKVDVEDELEQLGRLRERIRGRERRARSDEGPAAAPADATGNGSVVLAGRDRKALLRRRAMEQGILALVKRPGEEHSS